MLGENKCYENKIYFYFQASRWDIENYFSLPKRGTSFVESGSQEESVKIMPAFSKEESYLAPTEDFLPTEENKDNTKHM